MTDVLRLFDLYELMESPASSVQRLIESDLQTLLQREALGDVSDADFVSAYLLAYFRRSIGNKWLTRFPKPIEVVPQRSRDVWWAALPWDWTESERKSWIGFSSLSEWLSQASVYKVSQSALRVLGEWQRGNFQIALLAYIPTPSEVLKFQVQGVRPVSLLTRKEDFWVQVERFPNAFELTIHDLIHADRFQKDPTLMKEQIHFFRLLEKVVESKILVSVLERDRDLEEDFDYVLSDMNTVPVHGLQYLKAILIQHFLRHHGFQGSDKLAGVGLTEFETLFQKMTDLWNLPKEASEALKRVCTPSYRADVDGPIIQRAVSAIEFSPPTRSLFG